MTEKIIQRPVEEEITESYITYAMSVIVSRALPDVRDGLKPVLRRILYAMYDMRLFHNSKFKKSAAVVWEVLWKYHPHGDSSVYEAMVRLAQPFSLRYPLVDWQWNFGSIDWDWAAAQRYTEARLTKLAEEMLQDIDQDTVDWRPNYDNSREEPISLPTKFPNHLCNWTMWIAVWMATNMAPHNLNEVIEACLMLIENPEADIDQIMEIIKWPDFPTGWIIFDSMNIKDVYSRWKWSIIMRWKTHTEVIKWHPVIVITEVPYQVNKANLVAKIWEMVNEKILDWITDITDESNKNIIRVTITLRKGIDPKVILTKLYKMTDLQTTFGLNNVVLVEKWMQPRILNIKELLSEFVQYKREVIYRRSVYQLNKATDRLHILQWLKKAIDILDEVIHTIRHSDTRQQAKDSLMTSYEFSDPQAEYILMLRLQTLVWLEIQKILEEIKEKQDLIDYLTKIVENPAELDKVVIDELIYIKEEYGDERRTEVSNNPDVYALDKNMKNLKRLEEMQKEDVIMWVWNDFETKILYQSRVNVIPEETLFLKYTHNQDRLVTISSKWELVIQRLKDLWSHNMKGKWIYIKEQHNLWGRIVFEGNINDDFEYLVFLTNFNNIKKLKKEVLESFRKFPTNIIWLDEWEEILKVEAVKTNDHLAVVTEKWKLLIFNESQIRPSGKTAGWVKAVWLEEWDNVVTIFLQRWEPFIFIHTENKWKLLNMEDLKIQKRWGKWVIVAKLDWKENLKWWLAIDEGWIRIRLVGWQIVSIHSNEISLMDPETELEIITQGKIEMTYRPWEEIEENLKNKNANYEDDNNNQLSLFDTHLTDKKIKVEEVVEEIAEENEENIEE